MKINLNDRVRIVPNERTQKIYDEYIGSLGLELRPVPEVWMLWEWAEVFGRHLHIGSDPPHAMEIEVFGKEGRKQ